MRCQLGGSAAISSLCAGIVLGIVTHGGLLLAMNRISAGNLMSFLVATQTIQRYSTLVIFILHCLTGCHCTLPRSLGTLSVLFGQVVRGVAAGSRVFEYMELHPSVPLVGGTKVPVSEIEGRVEFKNITFSYPGRPEQVCLAVASLTSQL